MNKEECIKCVVWDLDNTIWDGTLLEDSNVSINKNAIEVIKELDNRGILQSVSSKNEYKLAFEKLKEFKIDDFFLYPQINWASKSSSLKNIANNLNISINSFAFIDDQAFEREEVNFVHPHVLCIDSKDIPEILTMPMFKPRFITEDSNHRRLLYMTDIKRKADEENWEGPSDSYLASLNMRFHIRLASESDLQRAEELTVRTHQLNATGYTYSYDELDTFRSSNDHLLFVLSLEDKFGTYGTIGLTLVECQKERWLIKLLLMSCRVMSRGVGSIMINYLKRMAKEKNVDLFAEYVPTDRNRMMYMTFKFSNFIEYSRENNIVLFKCDLFTEAAFPTHTEVITDEVLNLELC